MTLTQLVVEVAWHPLTHAFIVGGAIAYGAHRIAQAVESPQVYNVTNVLPIDKDTENRITYLTDRQ